MTLNSLIFSIFFIGENGGISSKNWLLILSAAFSIEQTLVGMTNALVALYNLKKPSKIEEQRDLEDPEMPLQGTPPSGTIEQN